MRERERESAYKVHAQQPPQFVMHAVLLVVPVQPASCPPECPCLPYSVLSPSGVLWALV